MATKLIWETFSGRMRTFIARRVNNKADAEDILQDVFLRIHERLDTLKSPDRASAWMFQITRNAIIDYYRSPRKRREIPLELTPKGSVENQGQASHRADEAQKAFRELASCLQPLIRRLPAEYREAISLVEVRGTTQTAAAKQLGLSVSGMKSRVQRGREKLKAMLAECCHIHLDRGGRVLEYDSRRSACPACRT